jgi:hypothetical protein
VSFDYLDNLRKKNFFESWVGVMNDEKPNQGVREMKMFGIHWSRKTDLLKVNNPF